MVPPAPQLSGVPERVGNDKKRSFPLRKQHDTKISSPKYLQKICLVGKFGGILVPWPKRSEMKKISWWDFWDWGIMFCHSWKWRRVFTEKESYLRNLGQWHLWIRAVSKQQITLVLYFHSVLKYAILEPGELEEASKCLLHKYSTDPSENFLWENVAPLKNLQAYIWRGIWATLTYLIKQDLQKTLQIIFSEIEIA